MTAATAAIAAPADQSTCSSAGGGHRASCERHASWRVSEVGKARVRPLGAGERA
jgi:hypothetical protein